MRRSCAALGIVLIASGCPVNGAMPDGSVDGEFDGAVSEFDAAPDGAIADIDGGSSLSVDELSEAAVEAVCDWLVDCGMMPDEETCRESLNMSDGEFNQIMADVEAGVILYDDEKAAECLASFAEAACEYDSAMDEPEACDEMFTGTRGTGETCYINEECASASCSIEDCEEDEVCCVGACQESGGPIALGDECSLDDECADGAFCDYDWESETGVCAEKVGLGEECTSFEACSEGVCIYDDSWEVGTCVELPAEGEPCDVDSYLPCARFDNYCDPTSATCVERKAVGDTCDAEAMEPGCVEYATCAGDLCVEYPSLGDECADDEGMYCLGSLSCEDGECTAADALEPCPSL